MRRAGMGLVSLVLLLGCAPEEDSAAETDAAARDEENEAGDESSSGTDTEGLPEGGRAVDAEGDDGVRRIPCGADGSFSYASGEACVCFSGFAWCEPDDPLDLTCCSPGSETDLRCGSNAELVEGGCQCLDGHAWCSAEPESLSCCPSMGE